MQRRVPQDLNSAILTIQFMADPEDFRRNRQPHASVDHGSRTLKAKKIVAIVGSGRFQQCRRILEIGCGSGIIAHTLFELGNGQQIVEAVDVVDSRTTFSGYHFTLTAGTLLPFGDQVFDLVITNHVIEHVGDESAQIHHLREIKRVIDPHGIVYFAAPNKWRLVEPHIRLPLLSWLPQWASDVYVRVAGGGTHYDCFPRSLGSLKRLFRAAGFDFENRTTQAIHETIAIERRNPLLRRAVRREGWTDRILTLGMPLMPTYVFCLTPPSGQ